MMEQKSLAERRVGKFYVSHFCSWKLRTNDFEVNFIVDLARLYIVYSLNTTGRNLRICHVGRWAQLLLFFVFGLMCIFKPETLISA